MERPRKRPRLNSVVPPEVDYQDIDLHAAQVQNDRRLKSKFESIFAKYGRDFSGVGDEIDLETGDIIVDNGHLSAMTGEQDVGDIVQNTQMTGRSLLRALTVVPESQDTWEQDRNAQVNGRSLLRALTVAPENEDVPFDSVERDSQDTGSGDEGQSFGGDEWDEFGEELEYDSEERQGEQANGGLMDDGYDSSDSDDSILGPKRYRQPSRDTSMVQMPQRRSSAINGQQHNARPDPFLVPLPRTSMRTPSVDTTQYRHTFGDQRPIGSRPSLPTATPNTRQHGHFLGEQSRSSILSRTNDQRWGSQTPRNGIVSWPRPSLPATSANPSWRAPSVQSVYATQAPRNAAINDRSYNSEPRPLPTLTAHPSVLAPADPIWYAPPLEKERSVQRPQSESPNLPKSVHYTSPNSTSLWAPVQTRSRKKKAVPPVPVFSSPHEVRGQASVKAPVPPKATMLESDDSDDPLQDTGVTTPGTGMQPSRLVTTIQTPSRLTEISLAHGGTPSITTGVTRDMPTPSKSRISTPESKTKEEPIAATGDFPSAQDEQSKKGYHIEYPERDTESSIIFDSSEPPTAPDSSEPPVVPDFTELPTVLDSKRYHPKCKDMPRPPWGAEINLEENAPSDPEARKFYFASARSRRGIETRRRKQKEKKEVEALQLQDGVQGSEETRMVTRSSSSHNHNLDPRLFDSFPARNVVDLEHYESDQFSIGPAGVSDQDVGGNTDPAEDEEINPDQDYDASMELDEEDDDGQVEEEADPHPPKLPTKPPPKRKRKSRARPFHEPRKIQIMPRGMTEEEDALLLQKKEVEGLPWAEVLKYFPPPFTYNKITSRYYLFLGPAARERRKSGLTIRGRARKIPVELTEEYIKGVGDGNEVKYFSSGSVRSHGQEENGSGSADSLLGNNTRETTSVDTYADRPSTPLLTSTIQPFLNIAAPAAYDNGGAFNGANRQVVDEQPDFSGSSPELDRVKHSFGEGQSNKGLRDRFKAPSRASTRTSLLKGEGEKPRQASNDPFSRLRSASV